MISILQRERYLYEPKLPKILREDFINIKLTLGEKLESQSDSKELKDIFKFTYGMPIANFERGANNLDIKREFKVGVILSGGQAPGGHNVICGIYDAFKKLNKNSKIYGFLGGPSGFLNDKKIEFSKEIIDKYRNTGGFDIIGSGRTKIETQEDYKKALKVSRENKLNAVVIIGGDDSNTNAALLADFFKSHNEHIQVIGVPKTIDGDLKNSYIETSFGFDTASKVYSELIGNIARDALSAKKYWHFIKLMGRSASHIALECALQTQPNVCLISEEVFERGKTLNQIVDELTDVIVKRADKNLNFGLVLIPEGLIEFIPEMSTLIHELNDLLAKNKEEFNSLEHIEEREIFLFSLLNEELRVLYKSLPITIQRQLLMDRDPHGNVQVSRIETEKLLIELIEERLKKLKRENLYKGSFNAISHFFGYEGRCAAPSNFDSDYCYSLGFAATLLILNGLTGYVASLRNLKGDVEDWVVSGIPATMMMNIETRLGKAKPVIKKALVELDSKPFKMFESKRATWALEDHYIFTGSIQYYGPKELCDLKTKTLLLERE